MRLKAETNRATSRFASSGSIYLKATIKVTNYSSTAARGGSDRDAWCRDGENVERESGSIYHVNQFQTRALLCSQRPLAPIDRACPRILIQHFLDFYIVHELPILLIVRLGWWITTRLKHALMEIS